jgi:hypothetical protein
MTSSRGLAIVVKYESTIASRLSASNFRVLQHNRTMSAPDSDATQSVDNPRRAPPSYSLKFYAARSFDRSSTVVAVSSNAFS